MSDEPVFDSSVVLAFLFDEPLSHKATKALSAGGRISAVNVCESCGRLMDRGIPADAAAAAFRRLKLSVIPFDEQAALAAASLKAATRSKGLSLGDRACLALAGSAKVFTCDRRWLEIQNEVDAQIVFAR